MTIKTLSLDIFWLQVSNGRGTGWGVPLSSRWTRSAPVRVRSPSTWTTLTEPQRRFVFFWFCAALRDNSLLSLMQREKLTVLFFQKTTPTLFESVCASAEGGAERGQEDVLRQLHPSSHWTSSGQHVEKFSFIIYFNMHIIFCFIVFWRVGKFVIFFCCCCCCFQGESFVCGSTHPKKPVWGGCGQSSGRRHQGDSQRPRHWAGGQRCQQTHLLRHLHSRSENWGTETDCQRFFNVMKCRTAKVKTSKASQKWHTSVQLWSGSWSALFQNQGKPQVCWKNNLPVVSSGSWCLHCYIFSCVCLTLFVLFLEHSHQNDVYMGGEQ